MLFANPVGNSQVGKEGFIGKVLMNSVAVGATLDVNINFNIIPGLESVVFMPKADDSRLRMATLGNMINKSELGLRGPAVETIFTSYFCFILPKPRAFGLIENAKAKTR